METIKKIYDWVAGLTEPMRAWKYGEDGKYIHIMMGLLLGLFFVIQTVVFDVKDLNLAGLVIGGFAIGFLFEKIQEFFFGSLNTKTEQVIDALWVMVGSTAIGLGAYYFDIARLYY